MDCPDFLDAYSDFRDGLITDPLVRQRMRQHLVGCVSCGRYDASVRHGVRAVGEVDVSPDFRDRLRQRIAATAGRPLAPAGPGPTSVAAGLMLAAAVALLVYERTTDKVPAVAVERASDMVAAVPLAAAVARPAAEADAAEADSLSLPQAIPVSRTPMVVVGPGTPFILTDVAGTSYPSFRGSAFSVQTSIPLENWGNLPR